MSWSKSRSLLVIVASALLVLVIGTVLVYEFRNALKRIPVVPGSATCDFGEMAPEQLKTQRLTFRNNDTGPVYLSGIRVSCPCVSSSTGSQTVFPGKEIDVEINLNTNAFNADTFDASRQEIHEQLVLELVNSAGTGWTVPVNVKAVVLPLMSLAPVSMRFKSAEPTTELENSLNISRIGMSADEFSSIEITGPSYYRIQNITEVGPADRKRYKLQLTVDRPPYLLQPLRMSYVYNGRSRTRSIPSEYALEDVTCEPSVYFFNIDTSNLKGKELVKISTQRFTISSKNGERVILQRIKQVGTFDAGVLKSRTIPSEDGASHFDLWLDTLPQKDVLVGTILVYYCSQTGDKKGCVPLDVRVVRAL